MVNKMFVFLFVGESGSGKSTIVNMLNERQPYIFNIVKSYTTREKRDEEDNDHIFIEDKDDLKDETIVAETEINGNYYASTENQFSKDKLNLYIVDVKGIEDVKKFFKDEYIIVIQLIRKNIVIDEDRADRNINTTYQNSDYYIENNSIENTYNEIHKVIFNEIRYL